ncbi:hypothetical protein H5200_22615 [Pseudoalteromonas sp. SG43-7]|uniref:hypothetical protein n=1 Tax=unclassified Pseudoalteromonas TaxID=194690 RepID=UPI001600F9F7|nr:MULTISPECIES: hypothetical protein [unclassified Pseudoalteromonas]MBB1420216.1 hypothetical protein [Pseudoalteromonas sp. SG44-1]MBB1424671.1 hypothetical protein [Pseudoalteromonas sp. SG43-7]MBB1482122.1 hypothetical protein [Pseudoalteromonas sp. SG41-2]
MPAQHIHRHHLAVSYVLSFRSLQHGNDHCNGSLGPQWAKAPIGSKKGDKTRVQLMDEQVENAFKKHGPDAKLNIQLERCPLNKR